jgi:peptide/nickel transport system permease protein
MARARPERSGVARVAAAWLAVTIGCALAADWLPLTDPAQIDLLARGAGPHAAHWLGTDGLGRDMLARLVHGARTSLAVGLGATLTGLLAGGLLGLAAGYRRGRLDRAAAIMTDTLLAFPALLLALTVVAVLGQATATLVLALGVACIPAFARVARAQALSLREREFVEAARAGGAGEWRILWRHVLPNALPSVATFALVVLAVLIMAEGALSFLGLGVPPPVPSWGGMIAEGRAYLEDSPHVALLPIAVLAATVWAVNVVAERLRG